MQFEYLTVAYDTLRGWGGALKLTELQEGLDEHAERGWRLAEVVPSARSDGETRSVICVFERPRSI